MKVRLGYFPNVTHATAIVGVEKGLFTKALGSNKLETKTFKDGTEASEALNADAIDATYIGSGPAINLFQKSGGKAIRIVSGATSGGALAGRQAGDQEREGSQGQDPVRPQSSATRRTSRFGPGSRSRATRRPRRAAAT